MGAVLTAWAEPLVLEWDIWVGLHGALGWSGAHSMGVGSVAGVAPGQGIQLLGEGEGTSPLFFLIPVPFLHLLPSRSHLPDPGPGARPQPIPCWPKQDLLPCGSPGPAGGGAGSEGHRHHSVFPGSGTGLPGPQVREVRLCQVL